MRISIKKRATTLLLGLVLALGAELQAQQIHTEPYGIHFRGGTSWYNSASSNIGDTCSATGFCSFAGGYFSNAQGSYSFAFGNRANASGDNSVSLGFFTHASQNGSIVIGSGANVFSPLTSTVSGIMMGLGSNLPTMFLSPATGAYSTGKVGIGNVTALQAKLHIVADEFEDASIFLQPTGKNGEISSISMTDSNHQILVREDGTMLMNSNNKLELSGSNVSLSGNTFSLGSIGNRKFYATAQGNPAIYSNAFRSGNDYYSYSEGPSYAIEFTNNGMLFRTAINELPRNLPISNWRNALSIRTNGAITLTGKVGINTENNTASYALAVDGGLICTNGAITLIGKVGVNTENNTASYALAVDGGLISTKVYIQDVEDWPDYVFDNNYKLLPINELRRFIINNRHLPEIPPEEEIVGYGYDIDEMQRAMLKKIEELTLYTLQQQEEIEVLRKMVEELRGK